MDHILCGQDSAYSPTASCNNSGIPVITSETLNLASITKQKYLGTYTSTASLGSVTGGRAKITNYTLTNTTSSSWVIEDRKAPEILSLSTATEWSNGNVVVTIKADDWKNDTHDERGSGIQEVFYSTDRTNWVSVETSTNKDQTTTYLTTHSMTFANSGVYTYYYRVKDFAGNISEAKSININIDKTNPIIITVYHDPTIWTNQDVTVSIRAKEEGIYKSGISSIKFDGNEVTNKIEHLTEGNKVMDVTGQIACPQNGTYNIVVTDGAGNTATYNNYTITNIDKTPPTITPTSGFDSRSVLFTVKDEHIQNSKLHWFGKTKNIRDSFTTFLSDENYYVGSTFNTKYLLLNEASIDNVKMFFGGDGTYYFHVADLAGNVTTQEITIALPGINDTNRFTVTVTGEFTYDGIPHNPTVYVKDEQKNYVLQENVDYQWEVERDAYGNVNNINAGNPDVTVKGIGEYGGQVVKTYTIHERDLVVTPNKGQFKMQGAADPIYTYSYANNIKVEIPKFTGNLSRDPGEDIGLYTLNQGDLNIVDNGRFLKDNYNIVFNNPYSYTPEATPYPDPRPEMDETIKFEINDFDGFTTIWNIPANTTIKLPIPSSGINKYMVSWGDGNYDEYDIEAFPTHKYTNAGNYTIRIAGVVNTFGYINDVKPTTSNIYKDYLDFNNYLTTIVKYGNIKVRAMGFSYCTNLTGTLPAITGFENVVKLDNMFYNCTGLIAPIPQGYFKDLTNVRSAKQIFYNCINLTGTLDNTMFENDEKIRSFEGLFANCEKLTGSIPEDIFRTNVNVESFAQVFKGAIGLTGVVPNGLFENNKFVQNFSEAFANCTGITSIEGNAFANNSMATNYYRTFYRCTGLTTLDANLFAKDYIYVTNNNSTSHNDYTGTFEECTGLTGELALNYLVIGKAMFKNCNNITKIVLSKAIEVGNEGFYGADKLTHILISRDNFTQIGEDGFEFTGTPRPLRTFIDRNNEVLKDYIWSSDKREVDFTPPTGTVKFVSEKYPFTNQLQVALSISVTDDLSAPNNCEIAIINNTTYEELIKNNKDLIAQYEYDKVLYGEAAVDAPDTLYEFEWMPFVADKDWTIEAPDGIKKVYVYFKDEMGNISNVVVEW